MKSKQHYNSVKFEKHHKGKRLLHDKQQYPMVDEQIVFSINNKRFGVKKWI